MGAGRARGRAAQCGGFTGIIPVLAFFLIKFEWYWYLVFEVVFELLIVSASSHFDLSDGVRVAYEGSERECDANVTGFDTQCDLTPITRTSTHASLHTQQGYRSVPLM